MKHVVIQSAQMCSSSDQFYSIEAPGVQSMPRVQCNAYTEGILDNCWLMLLRNNSRSAIGKPQHDQKGNLDQDSGAHRLTVLPAAESLVVIGPPAVVAIAA